MVNFFKKLQEKEKAMMTGYNSFATTTNCFRDYIVNTIDTINKEVLANKNKIKEELGYFSGNLSNWMEMYKEYDEGKKEDAWKGLEEIIIKLKVYSINNEFDKYLKNRGFLFQDFTEKNIIEDEKYFDFYLGSQELLENNNIIINYNDGGIDDGTKNIDPSKGIKEVTLEGVKNYTYLHRAKICNEMYLRYLRLKDGTEQTESSIKKIEQKIENVLETAKDKLSNLKSTSSDSVFRLNNNWFDKAANLTDNAKQKVSNYFETIFDEMKDKESFFGNSEFEENRPINDLREKASDYVGNDTNALIESIKVYFEDLNIEKLSRFNTLKLYEITYNGKNVKIPGIVFSLKNLDEEKFVSLVERYFGVQSGLKTDIVEEETNENN